MYRIERCHDLRLAAGVLLTLTAAAELPSAPIGPAAPGARPPPDTISGHIVEVPWTGAVTVRFPTPSDPGRSVTVLDERLEERIDAMETRSEKWARSLETLRELRFPVIVGSIVQVEEVLPALRRYRFDGSGAAWIFSDGEGRPVAAAVTLNLPKLVIRNRVVGGDREQLDRMLEMHLAHEIYGHVVPLAASGDLSHPCRFDPDPGASPPVQLESCVMERERALLVDLGYAPRTSYLWHYWEERIDVLDERKNASTRGDSPRR